MPRRKEDLSLYTFIATPRIILDTCKPCHLVDQPFYFPFYPIWPFLEVSVDLFEILCDMEMDTSLKSVPSLVSRRYQMFETVTGASNIWSHHVRWVIVVVQPMPAEQLQKLKHYKDVLHRMIPYLRVPENRVPKEFDVEKVDAFEKQIVNIMETFKRRRQGAA